MAVFYPYCTVSDVEALNSQGETFSTSTKPTLVQVTKFLFDIASSMRSLISAAGYDVDNLFQVDSEVSGAITAGSDVEVAVPTGEGASYAAQEEIKIEGLSSGVLKWEFCTIKSISTDTLTITTIANSYDAATVTIKLMNVALRIVRDVNDLGVAAMAEDSAFAGISPVESNRQTKYWERYYGSKTVRSGIWAIENIPDYLLGADKTSDAKADISISSYQSNNSGDDDIDAVFTKDMNF